MNIAKVGRAHWEWNSTMGFARGSHAKRTTSAGVMAFAAQAQNARTAQAPPQRSLGLAMNGYATLGQILSQK